MIGPLLRHYASIVYDRLPLAAVAATVVAAAALQVALVLPPVFQASSTIVVEPSQVSPELVRSTVLGDIGSEVEISNVEVLTRETVGALLQRLVPETATWPEAERAEWIDTIRRKIEIYPLYRDRSDVFAIDYEADDPEFAAQVVNAVGQLILSRVFETRTGRAAATFDFMQREAEARAAKLDESEARLDAFTRENASSLPEALAFRGARLDTQSDRLAALERERVDLDERRAQLDAGYGLDVAGAGPRSPNEVALAEARATLARQSLHYAETSPVLAVLRRRVDSLAHAVAADSPEVADASGAEPPADPRARALARIDERAAAVQGEMESVRAEMAELSALIESAPAVEATITALRRETEELRAAHRAALLDLAQAQRGLEVETREEGQRLYVLEEAVPPLDPTGPNRKLIALAGLAAAGAIALALVVGLELADRRLRRVKDVRALLELEPLGALPVLHRPAERLAARARVCTVAASCVLLPAAVLVALYAYQPAIQDMFRQATGLLLAQAG